MQTFFLRTASTIAATCIALTNFNAMVLVMTRQAPPTALLAAEVATCAAQEAKAGKSPQALCQRTADLVRSKT